jgi:hypothetical protein
MSAKTPPALPADLTTGLRRLKLATIRQLAPELLVTAKTQRWAPEEVLRTLIEAEVAARDASNERARLKAATFPVVKTIEEFDLTASSIPTPTWAYLTSLEWIAARENLALIGPAGTGKTHCETAGRRSSHGRCQRGPGPGWSADLLPTPAAVGAVTPRECRRRRATAGWLGLKRDGE